MEKGNTAFDSYVSYKKSCIYRNLENDTANWKSMGLSLMNDLRSVVNKELDFMRHRLRL